MNFGFETLIWLDYVFACLFVLFPFGGLLVSQNQLLPRGQRNRRILMALHLDDLHYNAAAPLKGLKYFQCKSLGYGKPKAF